MFNNNIQIVGTATQRERKKYAIAGGIAEEVLGSTCMRGIGEEE
jgi:hypothetical protein